MSSSIDPMLQPAFATQLPAHIGRFRIEQAIKFGALGAVYQAHDPQYARAVAVKTLTLDKSADSAYLKETHQRFLREAEMAKRLQHPDIIQIFECGEWAQGSYIVMEWVNGQDLSTYTAKSSLLAPATVLKITARIADALAYAHTQGILHRDIKPANIMLNLDQNLLKVMDFGIACAMDSTNTRTGVALGTPTFMSPEQLTGQRLDGRSDLYSLGTSLFQLLTGNLPFTYPSLAKLMHAIVNEPAPAIRQFSACLPLKLEQVLQTALEKRPENRYLDGRHMAHELRLVAAECASDDKD